VNSRSREFRSLESKEERIKKGRVCGYWKVPIREFENDPVSRRSGEKTLRGDRVGTSLRQKVIKKELKA
jgi:hypothetical protein